MNDFIGQLDPEKYTITPIYLDMLFRYRKPLFITVKLWEGQTAKIAVYVTEETEDTITIRCDEFNSDPAEWAKFKAYTDWMENSIGEGI